jgi:ABC-type Fe3+ transport system substrate-binding protein
MFLREKIDPGFWQKWRALDVRIYPTVAPAIADLVRGENKIAVMGITTVEQQAKAGAPVKAVLPAEGAPFLTAWGGLSSKGRNPNAAKVLVNWITSKHGGIPITHQGAYAANSDAPLPKLADGTQYGPVNTLWSLPFDRWAEVRASASEEWRKMFGRR